jgi:hypothetical protein
MKNADDILRYIESRYVLVLEKPESYFESPPEMESTFFELELLYEFIVDDSWTFPACMARFGYTQFLLDRGYGAATFTTRNADNPNLFSALTDFWREYLASDRRKKSVDTE